MDLEQPSPLSRSRTADSGRRRRYARSWRGRGSWIFVAGEKWNREVASMVLGFLMISAIVIDEDTALMLGVARNYQIAQNACRRV